MKKEKGKLELSMGRKGETWVKIEIGNKELQKQRNMKLRNEETREGRSNCSWIGNWSIMIRVF